MAIKIAYKYVFAVILVHAVSHNHIKFFKILILKVKLV